MKKLLFSMMSLFFAITSIEAKTIHWLIFVDTTDPNVGEYDKVGRQVLLDHFVNEVNAALAPVGYTSQIYDYYGERTSPENCIAAVEMLKADYDDIIMFYYIGHGGRPNIDNVEYLKKNPWPQMCLAQSNPSRYIPLDWVSKQLASKNARLSITIGMCCNSLSPRILIKDAPTFGTPNYGATYMSGNKLKLLQKLFLNYKGSLLATSASPTQSSYVWENNICNHDCPYGEIDFYTAILSYIMDYELDDRQDINWKDFMGMLSNTIDMITNHKQTPIYGDSLLIVANAPQPSQSQKNKERPIPQPTTSQVDGWKNKLTGYFDGLINPTVDFTVRNEIKEELSHFFASGAVVRMLSQDMDMVVDKEDVQVFLGRLATSSKVLKVAVVDGTFDEHDKITSLRVKEIYKRKE